MLALYGFEMQITGVFDERTRAALQAGNPAEQFISQPFLHLYIS